MKPEPHTGVQAWLNDQAVETLYLSSWHPAIQPPMKRPASPSLILGNRKCESGV